MTAAPAVRLRGTARRYGALDAVQPTDLDIERGDFLAILGPSGCGKTTLLRMIGGFVEPSAGRIEIDGRDVTGLPPERRPTNTVFQGYGLFPHMNLRQNVAYGLKLRRLPPAEVERRTAAAIALVRLGGLEGRATAELSGGQQQRVALARALVLEPKVLLLDEPLAALDLKLRQAMQEELRRIHQSVGGTFVFVTHDQGEAMALASRIAVMNAGRIEQIGAPEAIYARPASRFVAAFLGEANLLPGHRRGGAVTLDCGVRFRTEGPDGPVQVMLRPEAIRRVTSESLLSGRVEEAVFLGSHVRYVLVLAGGARLTLHEAAAAQNRAVPGEVVSVGWSRAAAQVLTDD